MNTKLALLVVALFAVPGTCFAQGKPGGGAPPPTPAPNPGPTTTPGMPNTNLNYDRIANAGRAGDHLKGNVILTGGALPWDPIPVTVACDGKTQFTTNTDSAGFFIVAHQEAPGSTTIQADLKPVATQYVGCVVSAVLPGFDSSQLTIPNRNLLDNPNIGTIKLTREEGNGGAALSNTSAAAPKDAMKSFEKARTEWLERKPDRAQKDLQKAVESYPQFAEAWYQLGKIQLAASSPEAVTSFSKAVAADPKFVPPYEYLAMLSAQAQKWPELLNETNRAIELNPRGTIDIWYYNAIGNFQLNKLNAAEASASKSLSMDPLHTQPNTEQLLAVILASKGDNAGALLHLRNCLTYFPPGPNLDLVKQQIAQIEPAVVVPK